MAYNDKILQVLMAEIDVVPERCFGYQTELKDLLADVLSFEREHIISKINVVKKIADQVNNVGMFLYKSRSVADASKEEL